MIDEAANAFHNDMVDTVEHLKREIGYNATRFMTMLAESGGVEAARQLLGTRDASDGFTTLWEHGRLDASVEAHILLPWYQELFSDAERETAKRRLVEHRFDIERFLRQAEARRPAWAVAPAEPH